jgi:tetratricopeptide (TPR) repeat protein
LIVLDNAAGESQVRPLLPAQAGCLVVVTSRRRLKGLDEAGVVSLGVLPRTDALLLLRSVIGDCRAAVPEGVLVECAQLCGRLPLALRIAGALVRHRPDWSVEHLVGLLRDQHARLAALTDGERDLGAVFDLSYRSLPRAHRRLFRRLGLVPGPDLDAYAAAALADTDLAAATRLLEDLVDHNLLIAHAVGRYRLHDLIRLHARDLSGRDSAGDRDAALGRLLDYYQHTAGRAHDLVARFPGPGPTGFGPAHAPALPDPDAAWVWLRAERSNLLAALDHATANNMPERVIALTVGLASMLYIDGPGTRAISRYAAAVAAADRIGDRTSQARILTVMGDARGTAGEIGAALGDLQQALGLFRGLENGAGQASALTRLGQLRACSGDPVAAIRDLSEALDLSRDLGEERVQANALTILGQVRGMSGDLPGALDDLRQALSLFRDMGDRGEQANVLTRMSTVQRRTGDFLHALDGLREALRLHQSLDNRRGQAITRSHLGQILGLVGDHEAAIRDLRDAVEQFGQLGALLGQANSLTMLGRVHGLTGDHEAALHDLRQALELIEQTGARGNTAWALNSYAAEIAATGNTAHALALHRDALDAARETHQPDDEAGALEGIGACHTRLGDPETGATHLKQALQIFQHLSMTPDAHRVQARLDHLAAAGNPA